MSQPTPWPHAYARSETALTERQAEILRHIRARIAEALDRARARRAREGVRVMLVCLGCIQEGDDAIRVVCSSGDRCSRCGTRPEAIPSLTLPSLELDSLFRVRVIEAVSFDGGRPSP